MNDADEEDLAVWSYVHGEMNDPAREAFERRMAETPDLARAVEDVRKIDKDLRQLMPAVESPVSEESMVTRVLTAWEAEQIGGSDPDESVTDQETPNMSPHGSSGGWRWIRFSAMAVAAAACAILMVGVAHQFRGPISWLPPDYGTAPLVRGSGSAPTERTYSEKDLQSFSASLRAGIEQEYKRRTANENSWRSRLRPGGRWSLRVHLQELYGGALDVEVGAYRPNQEEPAQTWSFSCDSKDSFALESKVFSETVATSLEQMTLK